MAIVYLGLGTNLGDKAANLHAAVHLISGKIGKVISLSSFYATAPWGFESENSFLNAAICVETSLSPLEVLHRTQEIERTLGRTHKSTGGIYHDRIIDIDLLLYNKEIIQTPELTIPHPLMLQRDFVMNPLVEIAPDVVHPVFGKKLSALFFKEKKEDSK
ncbi:MULTISPECIES: 2-amino-4-hydroxy-6-hydroxymethyldihydropteridine diphosphokinase [Bacteroidaceae]|jgi:2-amino-4-hydroxy-6-hydroxymethyldihydropteridine diphosphokinase|uniref:2-amino-4-hydroxy-6- hydroxymethyldihydropteridine diphosphokinase n=1 Tax=Bacteroidaceae TaxID=815 RepID=UPI000B365696|nr:MULTISPECIES: 2-amino-4-hydroxy-6-hydroxymethyldihydropteridine diphosphokinase [Bacteroidaceae]MDM8306941.1 2-amino-4-hydroxy-6-hydroxymethyldihydropteridine diphosphokinase [Phocaeicola salanitronis]OUO18599.1 2-amino-4-hydroxy-6-hydroxymethyldihydropteridine diphosphokinase [Bacteroides sp. An322]HJC99099.1 2-amino-4-hydroxy-6-hydroxymethyldihydropteridine diphosphokinase [Candidatus Phocaeicola merdavium]